MIRLLVLYVDNLDTSRLFYSAFGLSFVQEQHGAGPIHYAATLPDGAVIEVYPRGDRPATRTRLALQADDPAGVADRLQASGFPQVRGGLAVDPDGNRVEIVPIQPHPGAQTPPAGDLGPVTMPDDGGIYLTIARLRLLLDGWPDDRPVLIGGLTGPVGRVIYGCHEDAETGPQPGLFTAHTALPNRVVEEHVPEPAPAGPFSALVLRSEVSGA